LQKAPALTALQASLTANQALNLQLAIETELLQAGIGGLGTFELPEAYGGYLGLTRQIVVNTIQNFQAAGQSVGSAMTSLPRAMQRATTTTTNPHLHTTGTPTG